MIKAINSANSFKGLYYTDDKFSEKQKKICKNIEIKLGDRINDNDYLLESGPNDTIHFYNYNVEEKKTNYFWTYNDTTETFDECALKQLDTLHKRNIGFSTILISSIVFTIGLLVSPVIKSFNPNKSKTPTEVVNKFDSIKNNLTTDTLDLTKPFVKK